MSVSAGSGSLRIARSYLFGRNSSRTGGRSATSPAPDPCGPVAVRSPQPTSFVPPSSLTSSPPVISRVGSLPAHRLLAAARFGSSQPFRQDVAQCGGALLIDGDHAGAGNMGIKNNRPLLHTHQQISETDRTPMQRTRRRYRLTTLLIRTICLIIVPVHHDSLSS